MKWEDKVKEIFVICYCGHSTTVKKTPKEYGLTETFCKKCDRKILDKMQMEEYFPKPGAWHDIYKGSTCMRTNCGRLAKYVFLKGEADIPVCPEHFEFAKKDLTKCYVEL